MAIPLSPERVRARTEVAQGELEALQQRFPALAIVQVSDAAISQAIHQRGNVRQNVRDALVGYLRGRDPVAAIEIEIENLQRAGTPVDSRIARDAIALAGAEGPYHGSAATTDPVAQGAYEDAHRYLQRALREGPDETLQAGERAETRQAPREAAPPESSERQVSEQESIIESRTMDAYLSCLQVDEAFRNLQSAIDSHLAQAGGQQDADMVTVRREDLTREAILGRGPQPLRAAGAALRSALGERNRHLRALGFRTDISVTTGAAIGGLGVEVHRHLAGDTRHLTDRRLIPLTNQALAGMLAAVLLPLAPAGSESASTLRTMGGLSTTSAIIRSEARFAMICPDAETRRFFGRRLDALQGWE